MSLRDWRQAIRTPPAYRVGNSTLRLQTQFITVIAIIGLVALIVLYAISSYGGSRVKFTNNIQLHNEEYDHQHNVYSKPKPSPSHQVNQSRYPNYNSTYPLTKPIKSRSGVKYRIGIISDLDTASKREEEWVSYFQRGHLLWNPSSRKVSVTWDPSPAVELRSAMAQGGRAMELSELVVFDGKLLALDDRTGVVYEIIEEHSKPRVVPWVLLPDGDGHVSKGFKSEWATVCHQQLYVGGLGKEWTTSKGELVNLNPMYVKRVSPTGAIEHLNWKDNYIALRRTLDIEFPGYVIHEAVGWSDVHQRWFFLPRRASKDRYDETEDEKKGTNVLLSSNEHFTDVQVSYVGEVVPTHGFSSFKFIPDTGDEYIVALKSSEEGGTTATFITVFSITGQVLMPETKVADLKYEGIEFICKILCQQFWCHKCNEEKYNVSFLLSVFSLRPR